MPVRLAGEKRKAKKPTEKYLKLRNFFKHNNYKS